MARAVLVADLRTKGKKDVQHNESEPPKWANKSGIDEG